MKYLFSYSFSGIKNGLSTNGQGAIVITATGDKITEKMIFDEENGAISIAKKNITGIDDITICPISWFKFDEDGKEQT